MLSPKIGCGFSCARTRGAPAEVQPTHSCDVQPWDAEFASRAVRQEIDCCIVVYIAHWQFAHDIHTARAVIFMLYFARETH